MKNVSGYALAILGGAVLTVSLVLSDQGSGIGQDPAGDDVTNEKAGDDSALLQSASPSPSPPVRVQVEGVTLVEFANGGKAPLPVRFNEKKPWYAGATLDVVPGRTSPSVLLAKIPAGQQVVVDQISAQVLTAEGDRPELVIVVCNRDESVTYVTHYVKLDQVAANPECRTRTWLTSQPFHFRIYDSEEERLLIVTVTSALYGVESDRFTPVLLEKPVRMDVNVSGGVTN